MHLYLDISHGAIVSVRQMKVGREGLARGLREGHLNGGLKVVCVRVVVVSSDLEFTFQQP